MDDFPPLPEIDDSFEPLGAAAASVLLALALSTMRLEERRDEETRARE